MTCVHISSLAELVDPADNMVVDYRRYDRSSTPTLKDEAVGNACMGGCKGLSSARFNA